MAKLSDEINQLKYEVGRFLYLTSAKPLNKTPLNILMALVIAPSFQINAIYNCYCVFFLLFFYVSIYYL